MPAEWEPHEATWLAWPTNRTTWPGRLLKEVEDIYLQMMRALLPGEKVHLLVPEERTGKRVLKRLRSNKTAAHNLVFHKVKTKDAWIRDYGPIFVKRKKETAFTKWAFNAWGGKYKDLARDNTVVDRVGPLKKFKRFQVPMVLEGGSIDMNGRGVCLTTEQCLLNKNRNPKLTRDSIEEKLHKYLGAAKVIWLKEGIEGDDTDGHVDDITRFAAPKTILTAVEPGWNDKNHACLTENLRLLRASTDQDGKPFNLIELPMPGRVESKQGRRLPASYANFYIGNQAVLTPIYSHRNDAEALRTLRSVFKGRKVVGIECTPLIYGLGSIHCVTQQQPA